MARTTNWRKTLVAAAFAGAAIGCEEQVTAPGACPDFCPSDSIQIVDTVLTGIVTSDTSIRGFTDTEDVPIMVLSDSTGYRARGLVRFATVPERWFPIPNDTAGVRVGTIDSVTLQLQLAQRDSTVKNLRVMVVPIPETTDTSATFASTDALFANPVDSVIIPDSVKSGVIVGRITPLVLTPSTTDSLVPAYGLMIRGDSQTIATVLATEFSGGPPRLRIYVHGEAPRDTFRTVFEITPVFDDYVQDPVPPAPVDSLITVGNQPAARAFLRFTLPANIADSATVIRATLLMRYARPAFERPGIQYQIEAAPVIKDFGGKSIVFNDTAAYGFATIVAGDSGTLQLEMANVMRLWRGVDPDSLPRVVVLRNANEGLFIGQVDLFGVGTANPPRLQITYVRPLRFGVP